LSVSNIVLFLSLRKLRVSLKIAMLRQRPDSHCVHLGTAVCAAKINWQRKKGVPQVPQVPCSSPIMRWLTSPSRCQGTGCSSALVQNAAVKRECKVGVPEGHEWNSGVFFTISWHTFRVSVEKTWLCTGIPPFPDRKTPPA